jgi:hypothetical protein
MVDNKTGQTEDDVGAFLDGVEPAQRRDEARIVIAMMQRVAAQAPAMWGPSIIGFGRNRYRYESGREGEMARISFSPRKAQLVFYGLISVPGVEERLARLGKHNTGKGCLYVKKLTDIDLGALEDLARLSYETRKADEID